MDALVLALLKFALIDTGVVDIELTSCMAWAMDLQPLMVLASLPLAVFVLLALALWTCLHGLSYFTCMAIDAIVGRIYPSDLLGIMVLALT